jgi:hypothetical protein
VACDFASCQSTGYSTAATSRQIGTIIDASCSGRSMAPTSAQRRSAHRPLGGRDVQSHSERVIPAVEVTVIALRNASIHRFQPCLAPPA